MKIRKSSRNWIVGSMSGGARGLAAVLSVISLTLVLALGGITYSLGSGRISTPTLRGTATVATGSATSTEEAVEGTELISDDAVPMAAAPSAQRQERPPLRPPVVLLLGVGVGAAAVSLVMRLRRIDANIRRMEDNL